MRGAVVGWDCAMRLVIAGVPKAGKTTLSLEAKIHHSISGRASIVRHTDDLIRPGAWSEVSAEVSAWLDLPGPWIIEGVAAVRALRKWLAAHRDPPCGAAGRLPAPCDRVLWLDTPRQVLTPGQLAMAKGCRTIWAEVHPQLLARGVHVETL